MGRELDPSLVLWTERSWAGPSPCLLHMASSWGVDTDHGNVPP